MSRLGAPADVLEHRFGAGPALTVGVEEEFILSIGSRSTSSSGSSAFLAFEQRGRFAGLISAELFESLIELHTPVCATVATPSASAPAARARPRRRRRGGLRLGSAGTHPFSLFERQRVTGRERYRALVDELQYAARRELVFGLHVHVAVDDPDRAQRTAGMDSQHWPRDAGVDR